MKRSLASILVAASSITSALQAQPILYGATAGGEGSASVLYTIDPATGVATPVGAGIGFDRCSALEASTAGVLFAACRTSEGSRVLVTIDRNTGVGTELGSLGLQVGNVTDISFAPDGTLYGYVHTETPILLTIDTTDGSASSVGNPTTGGSGNGLAFGASVLYHSGDDDLSTIDPTDASSAPLCTLAFPDSLDAGRINAMDENPATGVIFGSLRLSEVPQGEPQNFLVTLDPATCEVTSIGATVDNLDAIAFLVVPDLSLAKADSPDPVFAGSQLTYTITVENLGLVEATNVVVSDTLPAGTTLVSTTGCDEDPAGVPTCTIPSIAGGGSAVVTIVVTVSPDASGTLTNTATVAGSAANLDPGNDTAVAETTVVEADPFAIPSLSEWGLAVLALLLLAVGTAFVRRM